MTVEGVESSMPNSGDISLHAKFQQLEEQGRVQEEHDKILKSHDTRISTNMQAIEQLQNNALRLENIFMQENRDTRNTIVQTNLQLHELIKGLMGYNTGNATLDNELKMAKEQNEQLIKAQEKELKVARMESYVKIVSYLTGASGILYWLIGQ